jgi:type III secretory pathway component EscS
LKNERGRAAALPWLALLLGIGLIAGLIQAARQLSRQTRRTFNAGLLAATLVAVVMVLWNAAGWAVVARHVSAANREGSQQVELLSKARIAALTARADEALTLVARGSGAAFESDYVARLGELVNDERRPGLLNRARTAATDGAIRALVDRAISDVNAWLAVHKKLRAADDGGDFPAAVKLATGGEPDSAATIFNRLDGVLASAIRATGTVSDRRGADAAGAFGGQTGGGVVLTIVLLAGIAVGYQQRIAEYR